MLNTVAQQLGKFVDSTSNQVRLNQSCESADTDRLICDCWGNAYADVEETHFQADAYLELLLPHRAEILKSSAVLGQQLLSEYNGITYEELAVEIAVGAFFP